MKDDLRTLYEMICTLFEGDTPDLEVAIKVMESHGFKINEEGYIIDEEDELDDDDYEQIICKECLIITNVEKGTYALEKNMCEQCYCKYQGG